MGVFSSDRTIAEYADQIWHSRPVVLPLPHTVALAAQAVAPAASPVDS
jgi:starch phosphorylase